VFEVEVRNVGGEATAVGSAGPYSLVVDQIPNSLRRGTEVRLGEVRVVSTR
jgi:hypothetical protein